MIAKYITNFIHRALKFFDLNWHAICACKCITLFTFVSSLIISKTKHALLRIRIPKVIFECELMTFSTRARNYSSLKVI